MLGSACARASRFRIHSGAVFDLLICRFFRLSRPVAMKFPCSVVRRPTCPGPELGRSPKLLNTLPAEPGRRALRSEVICARERAPAYAELGRAELGPASSAFGLFTTQRAFDSASCRCTRFCATFARFRRCASSFV